jgi:hypothetical protein
MRALTLALIFAATFAIARGGATGLATCDSGPKTGWKSQDLLQKQLAGQGWKIRRIKEDGGCYEVYATDPSGKNVEAYFHPVTLKLVPTSRYP